MDCFASYFSHSAYFFEDNVAQGASAADRSTLSMSAFISLKLAINASCSGHYDDWFVVTPSLCKHFSGLGVVKPLLPRVGNYHVEGLLLLCKS